MTQSSTEDLYKPKEKRIPDTQYADRLAIILQTGLRIEDTPQGIPARTCFGNLPAMQFDLRNGVPLITERKAGFWKKAIAEIIAFINGARTIDEIESYGCDFWKDYRGEGANLGLTPDDMGPGSYGAAFHDFEVPEGGTLNQFVQLIEQIKNYPSLRTHLITPWKPYYTARGERRKVIVAPCHGWLHFRVYEGKLLMRMDQRSADFPIGVPSNMIQYAALLLMVAQVTGFRPWRYIHTFADAHIYENQVKAVEELVTRQPRIFPILRVDPGVDDLFKFRVKHFTLEEYDPHEALRVPYSP